MRITLDAPESALALDVDRAIHVGLMVNELVANAIKHAFPDNQDTRRVAVALREHGDHLQLRVADTGIGLPANLDLAQTKTLGLRIVHILARRLAATVTAESQGGACFTIAFPIHGEAAVEPPHE